MTTTWPALGTGSGAQFGDHVDWSSEPGFQSEPPEAPKAVRIAYLLEGIADEFRALDARALADGKTDVLLAKTCKLELGISWTITGEGSISFWVLEIGACASHERSQTVTVEMSLNPEVPFIAADTDARGLSPEEIIDWEEEPYALEKEEVTSRDGGTLRLAFMLEKLADEFRRARAGAAGKKAILRYDKVTLELAGVTAAEGSLGAKFLVFDLAASGSREETQTITVEMTPTGFGDLAGGGIHFFQ